MRPWSIEECEAYAQQLRDKTRASTAEHAAQAIEYLLGLVHPTQEWQWHQAPVKTEWGEDMVVTSVSIDKDHTVDLYCERSQTDKVEAMFTQQPVQEPVAWMWKDGTAVTADPDRADGTWTPLYTTPPRREWQGLTEGCIDALAEAAGTRDVAGITYFTGRKLIRDFARAIEAKLKEKNA